MTFTERYNGFGWTLDYRPHEPSWEAPYRLRILPNKQERQDIRIVVYSESEENAHEKALKLYKAQSGFVHS